MQNIDGILLLNKPQGLTSNAILQRVKRLFKAKKAGHTGSLDPLATGMLPICFGEATKFSQFLLDADKCYTVTAKLGSITDTGDAMGEVIKVFRNFTVTRDDLEKIIPAFIGKIQQVPPMYSALKHKGQPLYKFARAGVEIERKSRQVEIFAIDLIEFIDNKFTLRVVCSKGTYIRTLVEDIGNALNVGAHVVILHRDYTSGFESDNMHTYSELEAVSAHEQLAYLLPADRAVAYLPKISLTTDETVDLYHGKILANFTKSANILGLVRLYNSQQEFIGIGEILENMQLKPKRLASVK